MEKSFGKWIAVDWGTTSFRAYLMVNNDVLENVETNDGMKFVQNQHFENTLVSLIEPWLDHKNKIEILASGMVGSKQGWIEAPYQKTPCNLNNIEFISPSVKDNRFSLKIFSGVSQHNTPDVMRGEETQIAGFLYDYPNFNGSICLPGTHSKWVNIENGNIINFKTFMTGELFEIISKNSILIHSVTSNKVLKNELKMAVDEIFNNPEIFGNALFQLRADDLINSKGSKVYKSKLSGYLLGLELVGSLELWEKKDVILIGNPDLTELYEYILRNRVNSIKNFLSKDMVLKGLKNFKKKFS